MAQPQSDSEAPVSATHMTRGSRIERTMDASVPVGSGEAVKSVCIASVIMVTVLERGMLTLPVHTQKRRVKSVMIKKSA